MKDLNPRPPAPKAGALPDCAKRGKGAGLFPAVNSARRFKPDAGAEREH